MKTIQIIISILLAGIFTNCNDAEVQPKDYPIVETNAATVIDENGVTLNANVKNFGKETIEAYGFIISNNGFENDYNLGNVLNTTKFEARITSDLDSGMVYNYRAYIKTNKHMVFGNEHVFTSKGSGNVTVLDISPKEGFKSTIVKIHGNNFSQNKENIKVFVNNVSAKVISTSKNIIEFIIPESLTPGQYEVKLVNGLQSYLLNTKFKIPDIIISTILPLSGKPGTEISIYGENLMRGAEITVYFAGLPATVTFSSESLVKVIVPLDKNYMLTRNLVDIDLVIDELKVKYHKKFMIKETWETKQPMIKASYPINYEKAFVYLNKAYLFDQNYGDMYRYDPNLDSWEKIPNSRFTNDSYENSLYITRNSQVFRVGGVNYLSKLNLLWSYNLENNSWTQKPNLPFNFEDASYVTINNNIYVLTLEKQLWKCDFDNNNYERLNDFPDTPSDFFLSAFIANNEIYAIQYGKTWHYNLQNNTWTFKAANPLYKERYSQRTECFSNNNTGYALVNGSLLYKFDYNSNLWNLVSYYPGIRGDASKKTIFVLNSKAYFAAISGWFYESSPLLYAYFD